jgi:hypothetical protein
MRKIDFNDDLAFLLWDVSELEFPKTITDCRMCPSAVDDKAQLNGRRKALRLASGQNLAVQAISILLRPDSGVDVEWIGHQHQLPRFRRAGAANPRQRGLLKTIEGQAGDQPAYDWLFFRFVLSSFRITEDGNRLAVHVPWSAFQVGAPEGFPHLPPFLHLPTAMGAIRKMAQPELPLLIIHAPFGKIVGAGQIEVHPIVLHV